MFGWDLTGNVRPHLHTMGMQVNSLRCDMYSITLNGWITAVYLVRPKASSTKEACVCLVGESQPVPSHRLLQVVRAPTCERIDKCQCVSPLPTGTHRGASVVGWCLRAASANQAVLFMLASHAAVYRSAVGICKAVASPPARR